jgi:hypothetical protein
MALQIKVRRRQRALDGVDKCDGAASPRVALRARCTLRRRRVRSRHIASWRAR